MKRSRRYGSNQIASAPSEAMIATPPASVRNGTPATSSTAVTMRVRVIVVPRSGSRMIRPQKIPTSRPIGRASSLSVRGGRRRAR